MTGLITKIKRYRDKYNMTQKELAALKDQYLRTRAEYDNFRKRTEREKAAIYGDYSRYTSKPLRDFLYESNQGRDFFFVATREEALHRLKGTL